MVFSRSLVGGSANHKNCKFPYKKIGHSGNLGAWLLWDCKEFLSFSCTCCLLTYGFHRSGDCRDDV